MEDSDQDSDSFSKFGFKPQKEIVYNKCLPYADKLPQETLKVFSIIKTNLVKAVLIREIEPGCILWNGRLNKYLKVFGHMFSKEDHIVLIKLMYELILIPDLEPSKISKFASTLIFLLRKHELLNPEELQLSWYPLYKLCEKYLGPNHNRKMTVRSVPSIDTTLDNLIHAAKFYYPATATQEILDELYPRICPYDNSSMLFTMTMFEWFLPISVPVSQFHLSHELWLDNFMNLWEVCHNVASWQNSLLNLMSRLSYYNTGYIDWNPYVPIMFTRFLQNLTLPVTYRNLAAKKFQKYEVSAMALWIVSSMGGGSCTLKYLEKFMQTLESYYYSANLGRWVIKLKDFFRKLCLHFIQRLHKERFKKLSWDKPVPDSHKLTEEEIDHFVKILKPIVAHLMYSRIPLIDIHHALLYLATLRPNEIVPLILEKIYTSFDSLTEPHKLTSGLQCLYAIGRPMLQGGSNGYPEGPTHLVPLLNALLPGIDPNDTRKCFVTFQCITMFVMLVPLCDSSSAADHWKDLTEHEEIVCASTAEFEDFVLQFIDKICTVIESSSYESTRLEQVDSQSRTIAEVIGQSALNLVCTVIASQSSMSIFKSALRKLYSFMTSHILETKVSGRMFGVVCSAFIRTNPEESYQLFLPYLINRLNELMGDNNNMQHEEILDNELLYTYYMLSAIIDGSGTALLPYMEKLINTLERTLYFTNQKAQNIAINLLLSIINTLAIIKPKECRSLPPPFNLPLSEHLSIRDWGSSSKINNLKLEWYVPGEKEVASLQNLVNHFLCPAIECIESYINGSTVSKEIIRQNLNIICTFLEMQLIMPLWDEPCVELIPTKCGYWDFSLEIGINHTVSMPDGSNIRKLLADLMHRFLKKILQSAEDDTKSFILISSIYDNIIMSPGLQLEFENTCKSFGVYKKLVENRLRGNKEHIRQVLIDRIMSQHKMRQEMRSQAFTKTHKQILIDLYTLSVSHYSEVRKVAQISLSSLITHFPYSYKVLTPLIINSLAKDPFKYHEEFKGCLFVLLSYKSISCCLIRRDWSFISEVWLALLKSTPSEKPSVIQLMSSCKEMIHKSFPTLAINLQMPDKCLDVARILIKQIPTIPENFVSDEDVKEGLVTLSLINEQNKLTYEKLVNSLLDIIENGNLHWRYNIMALSFIRDLVHPTVKYNTNVVSFVLKTLLHDSIYLRRISTRITVYILKQHKQKSKKVSINPLSLSNSDSMTETLTPGLRSDNLWLQYNSRTIPRSAKEWDKTRYLHKMYHGYYIWPKALEMYAPSAEQPKIDRPTDELSPQEKELRDFFLNEENVEKLLKLFALEDKKGKDKFHGYRFFMFKLLFNNFGDTHLNIFLPHLERFVTNKDDAEQRLACEIIAAIIRGSKHWPFEKVENLWKSFTPLLRKGLANMSVDTVKDWCTCFTYAAERRDPNRHHWLFELLMEDPLRSDEASFIDCGRLSALQGALNQQIWRVSEICQRLFDYLKDYLAHPYENVRERISSILAHILEPTIVFSGTKPIMFGPQANDLIGYVFPQLNILYRTDVREDQKIASDVIKTTSGVNEVSPAEKDTAIKLLKTVCKWVTITINRTNYRTVSEFYQLFPLACLYQSYEADKELSQICTSMLSVLAQALTLTQYIPDALSAITSVAECNSWSARAATAEFLQVFVFHNMSLILSDNGWVDIVMKIVLDLLEDENVDVRLTACQALGGLLHCQFVPDSKDLLLTFKQKAKTRLKKPNHKAMTIPTENRIASIRIRHSGVLGLCAFINAYPYDIPPFLPEIFQELGVHLSDPPPIPATIRKTLGDFKRTHLDNWEVYKLQFTEEQLSLLNDLTVPPSYYA